LFLLSPPSKNPNFFPQKTKLSLRIQKRTENGRDPDSQVSSLHNPILKNSSESLIRRRSRLKKEKELGDIEREGMKKREK
jgi:hypothetical protein